jgi:hypothetical protein
LWYLWLLGAFAKLRKATISFIMSVHPSVRLSVLMEQLGSHWTDFHEIQYLSIFCFFVEVRHFTLESNKNNAYFTWRPIYIFKIISRSFLLEIKNVSDKICRENQNTLFWFNNFLRILCLLWDNVEKYFRAGCHRRQHGACALHAGYLRPHTHTLRICNTHCFSTTTVVAWMRLNVTLHKHYLSRY